VDDKDAYQEWHFRFYPSKDADVRCTSLRAARQALFLSLDTVAKRLGLSHQGYCHLEQSDLAGTISINSLRKCAAALGCELVYEIKPKRRFSLQIWEQLVQAIRRPRTQSALAWRAMDKMYDPCFRKEQGWSKNSGEEARGIACQHNKTRLTIQI
jgi:transcriptional regulator with XRE-family HTH domain